MRTSMLVGYTGFVGSNLDAAYDFTWKINSKNKEEAYGKNPDLLVYAGLRAEKFLANKNSEVDMATIKEAMEQIKKINPVKLVLISTVDVYKAPVGVDEDTEIDTDGLAAYGKNRYELEKWVREYRKDALIIRLPGLFGKNLKKNFLYDYIHYIPSMLKEEKWMELSAREELIKTLYLPMGNGFYKCSVSGEIAEEKEQIEDLKAAFKRVGFSALNFTDSRGVFQFYNLAHLWNDIQIALANNVLLLNIATEPVSVAEIYHKLTGEEFRNEVASVVPFYDYKSKHAALFGGQNGYFTAKETVLKEIEEFVR